MPEWLQHDVRALVVKNYDVYSWAARMMNANNKSTREAVGRIRFQDLSDDSVIYGSVVVCSVKRWVMQLDVYLGTHTRAPQLIPTIKRSTCPRHVRSASFRSIYWIGWRSPTY